MSTTDAVDNKSENAQGEDGIPSCLIYVDKEGRWFHKGAPIIHRGFLLLFYQSIRMDEQGRYLIEFHDQTCVLQVEDTPFVILRVSFVPRGGSEDREHFMLHLIDGTKEALNPQTLTVGDNNVLYCRIRNGQFKARFSRPSYYQLAQHIQEDQESGRFYLSLDGNTYFIGQ